MSRSHLPPTPLRFCLQRLLWALRAVVSSALAWSGTALGASTPAATLSGAGSTFDQPFFARAFYQYRQLSEVGPTGRLFTEPESAAAEAHLSGRHG